MRLLQLKGDGEFSLTDDILVNRPRYAILSHTWGRDGEEVTFKDLEHGAGRTKAGYRKLRFCGEQAARDGLEYFWVDTCCIDKSSSAELQEAINSMFNWYREADRCYVYLADVLTSASDQVSWETAFRKSRWFTRGWTLQELIAPRSVQFFSSNGQRLGDKNSLQREIYEITGIAVRALQGSPLSEFSVAERMSWAETRVTTREEDRAYSLLGIFNVHMTLIYSEGAENAFRRLEEEIRKRQHKYQTDEGLTVPGSDSDPSTREELISRLYFSRIDERLTILTTAQGTTCRWFLTSPGYTSWQDHAQQQDHGGFLWIKGHPGTGKSTLMKFLFEEEKLNTQRDPLHLTASFFFIARGTAEERSTTGLYRSLLHQLFQTAEELAESLEWLTIDGAKSIAQNGWTEEALKRTLSEAVRKLGPKSLTIFVDALDECDQSQAVGMISFFEELCDHAREAGVWLKICLSSRHYPTVVIQKGIEITLEKEDGHTEDIEQYVRSKLRLGKMKQAETIQSEILEKSSGVFLWAVLVIDIINSEYPRKLISAKQIRERLGQIPPQLSDLFEMILGADEDDRDCVRLCLQWILFATRPLSPQELYFAVQFGLDKSCSGYWDEEDLELAQMETFVISASRGLAQITNGKPVLGSISTYGVQFIHESVRDFLMGKYVEHWSGASGNFVGTSHQILRDCCLAQLMASPKDAYIDFPESKHWPSLMRLQGKFTPTFPFLKYSIYNVLRHSNSAQQAEIDQGDFLNEFPLQRWIYLHNRLETVRSYPYTTSADLLYIFAHENLDSLLRTHPRRELCLDIGRERYGPPVLAALVTGSYQAFWVFWEVHAEVLEPHKLHNIYEEYSENGIRTPRYNLSFSYSTTRSLSNCAARYGDEFLFAFICAFGKLDLEDIDRTRQTLLSWAAQSDSLAIVRFLVDKGVPIETRSNVGQTPLSYSARSRHRRGTKIFKLLLEKGADITSRDMTGRTPLSWSVHGNDATRIQLLLDRGADIESKDDTGRSPLSRIPSCRHHSPVIPLEMAKVLLERRADIESKDDMGWTALIWAIKLNRRELVELLLEYGADIESRDNTGRTPLSWASTEWHDGVKLLLDKGANPDVRGDAGFTLVLPVIDGGSSLS